jgi:hypothetical protein
MVIPTCELILLEEGWAYKIHYYYLVKILEEKHYPKSGYSVNEFKVERVGNYSLGELTITKETLSNQYNIYHFECGYHELAQDIYELLIFYQKDSSNRFISNIAQYTATQWSKEIGSVDFIEKITGGLMSDSSLFEKELLKLHKEYNNTPDPHVITFLLAKTQLKLLIEGNYPIYNYGIILESLNNETESTAWLTLWLLNYQDLENEEQIEEEAKKGLEKAESIEPLIIKNLHKSDPIGRAMAEYEGYEYYEFNNEPYQQDYAPQINIAPPLPQIVL